MDPLRSLRVTRRIRVGVAALILASSFGAAAEEQARPVACDPGLAIGAEPLEARDFARVKPREGAGTVHPHAVIVLLENDDLTFAVAVDASKADAKALDLLRFDFSGKGEFAGKPVVPLKVRRSPHRKFDAAFGPAAVQVKHGGRTIAVRVQGEYVEYDENRRRLTLELGSALEARCRFGKRTRAVRVVDGNRNFRFGDKATPEVFRGNTDHDTVAIDLADGSFGSKVIKAYCGHPALVDGTWYDVTLSADGKRISARPSAAKLAQLKVPHAKWSAHLAGDRYVLVLSGSTEPIPVPADRYRVFNYREWRPAGEKGQFACLPVAHRTAPRVENSIVFDAPAGKMVEVVVGSPLTASIATDVDGRTAQIDFKLIDAAGREVDRIVLPEVGWPEPAFEILDAKGRGVHAGKFRFR